MKSTPARPWAAAVCLGMWLVLRLTLLCCGGSFGEAVRVTLGPHSVSALVLRASDSPGSRPLLLAVHGGLAAKETLLPLCWEANRRGADCATIDALGHGASSRVPTAHSLDAMRSALPIQHALGFPAHPTYFIGHSMGAHLGCGAVFSCAHCAAIGQPVHCDASRIVYGTLHQSLGLPRAFYLPVSHVLEPWTPAVIATALDRVLPLPRPADATMHIARNVALAWAALAAMAVAGVLLSRWVRAQAYIPAALRGGLAALVLLLALALAGWRTLWWLIPTQRTDLLIVLPLVAAAWLAARIGQAVGLRHPRWGVLCAALLSEWAALLCLRYVPLDALRGLLRLPLGLLLPVLCTVAVWEYASRTHPDSRESAVFCATLLGTCLALLVPGF